MDVINSFISNLSSHASSINNQYLRPLLSFNSRNNTITAPEQVSEPTMAAGDHSIMIPLELEVTQPAARDSDDSSDDQEDNFRRTKKAVLPISLFIAATSAALFINAAVPLHFFFLVAPYNTLLNLSLFIGVGLAIYSIMNINSISDAEIVWVLRMLMGLGLVTIFIALVLRGLMVQTYSSLKPAWLLFFFIIVIGLIFLYLWLVWKKKNNIRAVPTP